jgi:hypothetical protein
MGEANTVLCYVEFLGAEILLVSKTEL